MAGWVNSKTIASPSAINVELQPETLQFPSAAASSARLHRRVQTTVVTGRGFFQFVGVAPGSYAVVAKAAGTSSGRLSGVIVEEAKEYVLRDELVLKPLAAITIFVDPPLDPYESGWTAKLAMPIPLSNYVAAVVEGRTAGGQWSYVGLEAGQYVLTIADSRGAEYVRENLTADENAAPVTVRVPIVPVRGTVSAAGEPLAAMVVFRDTTGTTTRLTAGDDGVFSGALPREGSWRIEVNPREGGSRITSKVEVNRPPGQAVAVIDIALPAGRLRGTTVDEQGRPIAAAVVLWRERALIAQSLSDVNGEFTFLGLQPGPALARAEAREGDSGLVSCSIDETQTSSLRLVVGKRAVVSGRVRTLTGAPVPGALLRYTGPTFPDIRETATGPSGEFSLDVARGTPFVDAVLLAPGFPTKIAHINVPKESAAAIELTVGFPAGALTLKLRGGLIPYFGVPGSMLFPLNMLFYPSEPGAPPRGFRQGVFQETVEAGNYSVCTSALANGRCITRPVLPGIDTTIDMAEIPDQVRK